MVADVAAVHPVWLAPMSPRHATLSPAESAVAATDEAAAAALQRSKAVMTIGGPTRSPMNPRACIAVINSLPNSSFETF
jgi:hypothetical protein